MANCSGDSYLFIYLFIYLLDLFSKKKALGVAFLLLGIYTCIEQL